MSWKSYFAIIVSSKAFSTAGEKVDHDIIKEADMPHWMDLDTLYLFTVDGDKDESEFSSKISGSQFSVIEPISEDNLKSKYNFIVETKDKFAFYSIKYCKELNRWISALRKAKLTTEEIARTRFQQLSKNIDPFIVMYKNNVCPNN